MNFSGAFSLTAWVKTDANISTSAAPILEGLPGFHGQDFWLAGSLVNDLFFRVGEGHYYVSHTYDEGKWYWRHFAAVYGGYSDAQIYINGTSHPVHQNLNTTPNYQPDSYYCGHNDEAGPNFYGSMACVAIYEKALSVSDVVILMNSCP